jgi:Fe-S cluster assembly protein SufD
VADEPAEAGVTATLAQVPFADLAIRSRAGEPTDACGAGVREAREEAFARFVAVGVPTSKDEEWRFTPVRYLATAHFRSPGVSPRLTESDIAPFLVGTGGFRVVVVDGHVDPGLSRLSKGTGLRVAALSGVGDAESTLGMSCAGDSATIKATPFAALNAALWTDGAALYVGGGKAIEPPIEILHVTTSAAANSVITPRTVIFAGKTARASVIESFASLTDEAYFTNASCQIVMDDGARLEHTRIQRESRAATHIGITTVHQAGDSHYRSFTLALGGKLSRHDLHAHLDAPNVETLLYGLYVGRGEQLIDNHTAIYHDQPNCKSWEVYKGVLAERARGVFNGKVIVRPEAQKTDAKQTNRNLLLSDDAKIDTKPQLEIFADDVKCTHGATVGKLDEQQRYYLRTRGIAGRAAEMMLISAFVAEVLVEVTQPQVQEALGALVHAEMDALIG